MKSDNHIICVLNGPTSNKSNYDKKNGMSKEISFGHLYNKYVPSRTDHSITMEPKTLQNY